jgi:redox-sensing transcriptional repressor
MLLPVLVLAALCVLGGLLGRWPVMLIGVGNLGTALAGYSGLAEQGFHLVAALDSDPKRVGQTLGQLVVEPVDLLEQIVPERQVQLAMLAVPAPAAEGLGRRLLGAGVRGILNFAPFSLRASSSRTYRHRCPATCCTG